MSVREAVKMASGISQKEYLQRYLSGKKKDPSKKKKTRKIAKPSVKIIDDDVDYSKIQPLEESVLDIFGYKEDAPQIAGIIDDQEEQERRKGTFTNDTWKIINEDDGFESSIRVEQVKKKVKISNFDGDSQKSDSDVSLSRANKNDSDLSPDRDYNSAKKLKGKSKKANSDSDLSPPRQHKNGDYADRKNINLTKKRSSKRSDSDLSPPRKNHKSRKSLDSDLSPPRKRKTNVHKDSDSDLSPPRRRKKHNSDSDLSPPRRKKKHHNSDSDLSPPRRKKKYHNSDSDLSPPNRNRDKITKHSNFDIPTLDHEKKTTYRTNNDDGKHSVNSRKSRWETDDPRRNERSGKMTKTLEGKKAGLQDAQQLVKENEEFRKREDELFGKLSEDLTGRNAATVKRDLKGRSRNSEADKAAEKEREERQKILDEKYSRWGKGIKQVEEHESRIKDFLHESSKPLARYKDDEDLDQRLRAVERLEDPMLEYIRKKKKEESKETAESYPMYDGPYPANRFNLRPGHRWDGVDRSNGYENNYFQMKSSKIAQEEEIYKWSTEDM